MKTVVINVPEGLIEEMSSWAEELIEAADIQGEPFTQIGAEAEFVNNQLLKEEKV